MESTTEPRTILIVDDDEDFLFQLRTQLEHVGHKVLAAGGREIAEQLLATNDIELAIVDLMMEETDGGFALCHRIKRKNPKTPVILVTAVTSETGLDFDAATSEERSWVKADALLDKPVRFEQLTAEMNHLLGED
jgi:two-component system, OmpR family, response regulator CpxR